ncbi:MAG: NAD(P)H-dependent oxidoreductase [Geminicoccaceae bacterium]|nr:NAD(P)H-dependent oxidoreductase [Geminicoccaceae bacterium]
MRVLLVYCHPVETSFNAALHEAARAALTAAGHVVDDLDLYREGFDPVLGREERLTYHDLSRNREPVHAYVDRLLAAEALVLCFPVWTFGPPALLKGFFDRVLLPGVAFHLGDDGRYRPGLERIRKLAAITTYGQPRWKALLVGDGPRHLVTRVLRSATGRLVPTRYLALYHMNIAGPPVRERFLARVERTMRRF